MAKQSLLFIPGLGDRIWLYGLAAPLWRTLGYEPHIHRFGWSDGGGTLAQKHAQLLRHVDDLRASGELYVIGVSAGGPAAINLLRDSAGIRKVVTVASPLRPKDHPTNALLTTSIAEADSFLHTADSGTKAKIASVHGLYDRTVPVSKSQRADLTSVRLLAAGHGVIILLALTLYAGRLRALLRP